MTLPRSVMMGTADALRMQEGSQLEQLKKRAGAIDPSNIEETARAARMFETMLAKQLFKAMRKTLPEESPLSGNSDHVGSAYMHFVDDAISQHLTSGKGLGIRESVLRSFGIDPAWANKDGGDSSDRLRGLGRRPSTVKVTTPGEALPGASGALQRQAIEMMQDGGSSRFSKAGTLSAEDLASPFETPVKDGTASFNATAADGYAGYSKCNLFALEAARRAGYAVPVVARNKGWGFPSADAVTGDALDGALKGDWARVRSATTPRDLDRAITSGQGAFLLVGSADGERRGHMAVLERVRDIERDATGKIRRIIFDGFEARTQGAQHLSDRIWNLEGNPGGRGARNGFAQIEVLQLTRPVDGAAQETIQSRRAPGASRTPPGSAQLQQQTQLAVNPSDPEEQQ